MTTAINKCQSIFRDLASGQMDFAGQDKAQMILSYLAVTSTIIGLFIGYLWQKSAYTYLCIAIGCGLSIVTTMFSWPCYRKNLVKWEDCKTVTQEKISNSTEIEQKIAQ